MSNNNYFEDAFIGSLITDNEALYEAFNLNPDDFEPLFHQDSYRFICSLIGDGKKADLISVSDLLEKKT